MNEIPALKNHISPIKFAFFGTPDFAVAVLDQMEKSGIVPNLIVTNPDKPQGRGLSLTASPVKKWAEARGITVMFPEKVSQRDFLEYLKKERWDIFAVAAYGGLLPKAILDLPLHGVLNVHPSLLPLYRGPSPVVSAILNDDKNLGISIILLDQEMDHGPILAQQKVDLKELNLFGLKSEQWPAPAPDLELALAAKGGHLLAEIIPAWINRDIVPKEQDHHKATFTKKITKEDGLLDLKDFKNLKGPDAYKNYLKIKALAGWPGTYFFINSGDSTVKSKKKIRVIIKEADYSYSDSALILKRVVPEGGKEMEWKDFEKSLPKDTLKSEEAKSEE